MSLAVPMALAMTERCEASMSDFEKLLLEGSPAEALDSCKLEAA